MDSAIISALLPLGEKLLSGIASALGESSPGQKQALSEVLTSVAQRALASQGEASAPASSATVDSQIIQAFKALAEGHTIELDMTLKVRPKT